MNHFTQPSDLVLALAIPAPISVSRRLGFPALALGSLLAWITLLSPTASSQDPTGNCIFVAGECCTVRPNFSAAAYAGFGAHVSVATASPSAQGLSVVAVNDLSNPGTGLNAGPFNTDWTGAIYSAPTWTEGNLGSVFGVTLDNQGNIYVTSTTCYLTDVLGFGGTGVVYKINGLTSAVTVFATLPNSGEELGNICFDCDHGQFFVSNMDDGRIYRLSTTGAVLSTFDFGAPDDPLNGFAPLGDRIWAVTKHNGRVYFSVWSEDAGTPSATQSNEIWSIALDGTGEFFGVPRLEITMPPYSGNYSNPVSDMRFSQTGSLFVAERGMSSDTAPTPHQARLLEFVCVNGVWAQSTHTFGVGMYNTLNNSAGGVDVSPGACGRVFVTGDALQLGPQVIYGTQALPLGGGTVANSNLIDFNDILTIQDKTFIGDVAVPCKVLPDECPDCNGNGIPDYIDIASGASSDCNSNGFPDECEVLPDCNKNGIPDVCDIASGTSADVDMDGIPDECQPASPGHPTCFGDGSGTPCPCGNNSPIGADAGCLNSTGSGAQLLGTGIPYSEYVVCPSVAPPGLDTVTLTVTGLPSNVFGIVFRGTTNLNGGAGVLFGDGLRCCGGQITRSGAQSSRGSGVMNFGYPATKLSVKLLSCAAVTYCYQVWYRNPTGPCATLFNTSNAYEITWLP